MRVRLVLAAGLLAVGAALVLTVSRRVELNAGSDHAVPAVFVATLTSGGALCQPGPYLAPGAASAELVVGTYGHPVPALTLDFTDPAGSVVAAGRLPAGAREGAVTIPIRATGDAGTATRLCLRVGGRAKLVVAGEGGPPNPSNATVSGRVQPGRISLIYRYGGRPRSWWSLRGPLDQRFGLGKARLLGDWTLPACGLLLLGAWGLALRLLLREAR